MRLPWVSLTTVICIKNMNQDQTEHFMVEAIKEEIKTWYC